MQKKLLRCIQLALSKKQSITAHHSNQRLKRIISYYIIEASILVSIQMCNDTELPFFNFYHSSSNSSTSRSHKVSSISIVQHQNTHHLLPILVRLYIYYSIFQSFIYPSIHLFTCLSVHLVLFTSLLLFTFSVFVFWFTPNCVIRNGIIIFPNTPTTTLFHPKLPYCFQKTFIKNTTQTSNGSQLIFPIQNPVRNGDSEDPENIGSHSCTEGLKKN